MVDIVKSKAPSVGPGDLTEVELTGTDTLGAKTGLLNIRNESAAAVTINILGSAASSTKVVGVGEVSLTGGYSISVPIGGNKQIRLGSIASFLKGATVNVTGGTAAVFASVSE